MSLQFRSFSVAEYTLKHFIRVNLVCYDKYLTMSMPEQPGNLDTNALFEKFQLYFNSKFEALSNNNKPQDDTELKVIKNKLEARELSKPGHSAQQAFCGELEILLARMKNSLLQKSDLQEVFDTIVKAEDLIIDRKQKIKIADSSKAGWVTVQHLKSGGKKD